AHGDRILYRSRLHCGRAPGRPTLAGCDHHRPGGGCRAGRGSCPTRRGGFLLHPRRHPRLGPDGDRGAGRAGRRRCRTPTLLLIMTRRLLRYGETATLVECRTTLEARALDAALRSRADSEIAELVPGANSVLIKWNGPARSRLIDFLEHGRLDPAAVADGPMITVP